MNKQHFFHNQTLGQNQLRVKTEHDDEQMHINLYKFPKSNRYRNSHYINFKKQDIASKKQQIRLKSDLFSMNQDYKINKICTLIECIENKKPYQQDLHDLLSQYSIFSKILNANQQFYKSLISSVTLEFYPKGKLICRLGQKVQKAYFILKGKLGIYTKINVSAQKLDQYRLKYCEQMIEEKNSFIKRKHLHQNHLNLTFQQRKNLEYSKVYANQDQINEWFSDLRRVSSFYQQQLIDIVGLKKNVQRVATLITDQETILICVSKNVYMHLLNKFDIQVSLREQRIECMKEFQIFSGWQKKLNMYSIYFQRKKFKTGQIIYKEGDIADKFYLIISGDVQLSMNVKKKNQNKQQFTLTKDHQTFKVSINILSKGNYIGQQQIINRSERKLTAQSIGAYTEVLFLTKQNFLIIGYGTEFFEHLKKNIIVKTQHRQKILKKFHERIGKQDSNTKLRCKSPDFNFKFLLNKRQIQTGSSKINNFKTRFNEKLESTLCHGNRLPSKNITKKNSEASLNLLQTNRQLYKQAQRKYKRKHNIKQPNKQKIEVHRNLKKVWKILNLDYLLTQQQDVDSFRKSKNYYYHHKLLTQSSEPKTTRPKSNTTYKQKLMYVNYLYDFNKLANEKNKQNE